MLSDVAGMPRLSRQGPWVLVPSSHGAQPVDGLGAHASRIDHAGRMLVLGVPQDERRLDTTLSLFEIDWDGKRPVICPYRKLRLAHRSPLRKP
jgi:hypothetical protein